MPSFCMRDWRVERLRPKRAAAPPGPATIQFAFSKAARICFRSDSARAARTSPAGATVCVRPFVPGSEAGVLFSGRRSLLPTTSTGPLVRITARSMTFCNSRMLPGHA